MRYRQLSALICNVWLTQQTISGVGPHVRAHPCGHRTREGTFRLLYNVHFTSQAATQVSHIFHFLSFFWEKKKRNPCYFLFLFFHHAPILLRKNLSTGANVNFNLSPTFFYCFKRETCRATVVPYYSYIQPLDVNKFY